MRLPLPRLVFLVRVYHRQVPRSHHVPMTGKGIGTGVITGAAETESRAGTGDMTEIGTDRRGMSE